MIDAGDPDDELRDCWVAKEKVRDVYLTDDPELAAERLDDAIAWCTAAEAGPELRRLVKTLRRWRAEILAHQRQILTRPERQSALSRAPYRPFVSFSRH